jgi:transcriptional regulator with XRE-family HTH domain
MPLMPNKIRVRRAEQDLTQLQVSQRIGVSASYLSLIENGHVEPSAELRADLARVLQTTETELFPELAAAAAPSAEGEATR